MRHCCDRSLAWLGYEIAKAEEPIYAELAA